MSDFQNSVNIQPAPALEGDFSSCNPRASMLAGPGTLVAGALGVTVGNFAWAIPASGVLTTVSSAYAAGGQIGFVHREQQALITAFLGATSRVVPQGFPVTLHNGGDFWDKFVGGAAIGQKVYAYYADGTAYAAATGTPPTFTATVTTATNTTLTVTAVTGTPIAVGQPVTGAGIAANTVIAAFGTGTGGLGTYTLNNATTASASVTGTFTSAVETAFTVRSTAAANELAKISTWG